MTLILGAGPAGLAAAYALGDRCTVLEASQTPGGLCRTIEFDGAVFDPGGHCLHTRHAEVKDLIFSTLPMVEYARNAQCLVNGELIPYPFQQYFEQLSDETMKAECRDGLGKATGSPPETSSAYNFEKYLLAKFGEGLTKHFLKPYNEKLWRTPLTQLATPWARERVAEKRPTYQGALEHNQTVAYPAEGAFGSIFTELAQSMLHVHYHQRVKRIDPRSRRVYTENSVYPYDQLICTLSLKSMDRLLDPKPPGWDSYFERFPLSVALQALPLSLILVTLDKEPALDMHRLYCASDELPAHKLVFNHRSSPWLQEHTRPAVMAETSQPLGADQVHQLVRFLEARGAQVRETAVVQVTEAYPIQRISTTRSVTALRTELLNLGIHMVGRFGEWAYINSDEAMHRGLTLGRSL
jgi:UDP-galactopyranose mutase